MKKTLFMILFIAFYANAQQSNKVDLKWKISDTLTYETIMNSIPLEKKNDQEEGDSISIKMSKLFKNMQDEFAGLEYKTKLFPDKNGNVDIAMMVKKEESDTTESLFSSMAKMNGGVVLRGKVHPNGKLLSTYYKSDQSNLISVLFELPTKSVKIGDKWSLKVDMISMDQNFIADSIYQKNNVKLKDIVVRNGNKIAIVEYDLEEYVAGGFGNKIMSIFTEEKEENEKAERTFFMKTSHKAIAEFDINQGFWILYDGVMEIETNISFMGMGGISKTEFKLIPQK